MPQRAALFARRSDAVSPRVSRGAFFVGEVKFPGQGRFVKVFAHPRFRNAVFVAIAAMPFCAGLSRAQSSSPPMSPASPAYREVADETGRTVRIPQPVQRIVSLAPSLTETVYALGLQDRLVGDTDYCDYPPDAQKKTKVGGGINPSLEQIAVLHPDLVLVTKGFNRLETVHALDNLGISSYATDPHTVNDIIASSRKLADLLGVPEAGASVAAKMEHHLANLQQRLASSPAKRVLFVVWHQPLISVGKDTFIADALHWAGAVSIVDSEQRWPQVNLEEVARLQPDFLVFAASHSESVPSTVEGLAALPGWGILDAVNNRRYAVISDAVNRPAPRILSAIEDLARQLHPDAFVEKPESGKGKTEKEIPPPNQRSFAQSSLQLLGLQEHIADCGGRKCAR
jgi:iron complex transport system substrate-binding protein